MVSIKTTSFIRLFYQVCAVLMLLAPLLVTGTAQANKIQLAYLQIDQQSIDNGQVSYQAMWKQPTNSNNAPLSIHFSDAVSMTKKSAPELLNGTKIQYFNLSVKEGLANHTITIENLEKTNVEVMMKYRSDDISYSVRLTPSTPSYTFKKTPSAWQTIQSYTVFGIEHILEGYDHLLFVLCLLLIASTTKKLLWAITGFTLAHSITLVLSTLNIVQLPIIVVEAVIALSIVFLATEIVKNNTRSKKDSLTFCYPVAVSSSFGLLHGFGFASVLLELGLPQNDQLLALAFFNIGVELGQLLFIASMLLLIWLVKSIVDIRKHQKINGYIIGSIASMWLIERVLQF